MTNHSPEELRAREARISSSDPPRVVWGQHSVDEIRALEREGGVVLPVTPSLFLVLLEQRDAAAKAAVRWKNAFLVVAVAVFAVVGALLVLLQETHR